MKLSEKGFDKILDACQFDENWGTWQLNYSRKKEFGYELEEVEFDLRDFVEDCVVFTKEEARKLLECVKEGKQSAIDMDMDDWVAYYAGLEEIMQKRIKEAEEQK